LDSQPLNEENRGLAEVEAHKPVIERETPHYFKCNVLFISNTHVGSLVCICLLTASFRFFGESFFFFFFFFFSCAPIKKNTTGKDVKANVVRTVKMTIRGITVLEEGTDIVVVSRVH
jgi:hypothetical protein